MKLRLQDTERLALARVFEELPWGGGEEELLKRDDVFVALRLEEFTEIVAAAVAAAAAKRPGPPVPAWAQSDHELDFELSPELADYLLAFLGTIGQMGRMLGRTVVRVIRKLRELRPVEKAEERRDEERLTVDGRKVEIRQEPEEVAAS